MKLINNKTSLKSGDSVNYTVNSYTSGNISKYNNISYIKTILKQNTISPRFRIYVLHNDETISYEIPPEDILSGGSYNENYQNGSRRTLSFTLINNDGKYTPNINKFWVGQKIRLDVGIDSIVDNTTIWFQKGVFVMGVPTPSKNGEQKTVSIDCSDKFSIFEGKWGTIPESTEIEVGTNIKDIFIDTLNYDKGNGDVLDPIPMLYDPSFEGVVTPLTISLSAGSTWSSLLTQLAEILSAEIFYDSEGRLVVTPIVETMSDGDKPVLYDFDESIMQDESFSFDMESFVNCIYVIGGSVNGKTYKAVAKNESPDSPLYVGRIGLRIDSPINDSNILSDVLAQERADYELRQRTIAKTTLSSSVFFNPLLSVNNIVTFTDPDFSEKRERFLLQSISFSLDFGGTMSISVSNINNLPFLT